MSFLEVDTWRLGSFKTLILQSNLVSNTCCSLRLKHPLPKELTKSSSHTSLRSNRATEKSRSACIINDKLSEDLGPKPGRALYRTFSTVEDELSGGSQSSVSLILFSSLQKKLVINHSDQEVTALPEGLIAELQLKGKGSKVRRRGVEVAVHKH